MKNTFKRIVLCYSVVLMILLSSLVSFSMDAEIFKDEVSEDFLEQIEKSLELEYLQEFPTIEKGFNCFDVSESGNIALGFTDIRNRNYIIVYDSIGNFEYGLSYNGGGNSYGLKWDGNNIIIYSVRGEYVVLVDKGAKCLEARSIQNNSEKFDYWRDEIFANEKIINGTVYKAENLIFNSKLVQSGEYVRLVKDYKTSQEIVIFENTFGITLVNIIVILCVLGFGVFSLISVIRFLKLKSKPKNKM